MIASGKAVLGRRFRWFVTILLMLISLVLIAREGHVVQAFRDFPNWVVALMICIVLLYEVCASIRMGVIGRCSGVTEITQLGWFKYHIYGRLANLILPQSGNIYRAQVMRSKHAVSYAGFIGMNGLNVWVELVVALTLCSILFLFGGHGMEGLYPQSHVFLVFALISVLSLPIVLHWFAPRKTSLSNFVNKMLHFFSEITEYFSGSIRKRQLILKLVCITTFMLALSGVAQYLGFWALGATIDIPALAIFVLLLKASNYVVLTPGNLGVRELAYGLIAGVLGVNVGQAIMVSLMIRGVSYVNIFSIGLLFGWREIFGSKPVAPS